jgi:hypothetical protein
MQFDWDVARRDRSKIRMRDMFRERRPSSSQGKRYVVCCIMYLTRYVATEVAHHSRFGTNLPLQRFIEIKSKDYFGDI